MMNDAKVNMLVFSGRVSQPPKMMAVLIYSVAYLLIDCTD